MFKRTLIFSLCLGSSVSAYQMDDYIRDHSGEHCNGESPECHDFDNEAIQLWDQRTPVSPEVEFDINDNHGKLELELGE